MFVKEITVMNFDNYFPVWNELNTAQKKLISDNLITQQVIGIEEDSLCVVLKVYPLINIPR